MVWCFLIVEPVAILGDEAGSAATFATVFGRLGSVLLGLLATLTSEDCPPLIVSCFGRVVLLFAMATVVTAVFASEAGTEEAF